MSSSLGLALDATSMDAIISTESNQSSGEMFGCDENGKCIVNPSGVHDRSKNSKCWIFGQSNEDSNDPDSNLLSTSSAPEPPSSQSNQTGLNDDSFVGWDDDDELVSAIDNQKQEEASQNHDRASSRASHSRDSPNVTVVEKSAPGKSMPTNKDSDKNDIDDDLSDIGEPRKKRGLNSDQVRDLLDRDDPPPDDLDKDDILNGDGDLDEDMDVGRIKAEYLSKLENDDDDDNDNLNRHKAGTLTKKDVLELLDDIPKPMVQSCIQPGASPEEDSTRFLCWNTTGIIRAQFGEDQCIDVMFHDSEKHSSVNFHNEPNYTFGSLSSDVIVMGTNGKFGTGPAAVYGINLLEGDSEQRDWQVNLPHVELIEALAAGSGFVAIVTDKRYLRLTTHGGMQSHVISLPGQVLCMNAHEKQLLIVYHNGAGHPDDQNLSMATYHVDLLSNKLVQLLDSIPVALSKRSPLAWAGFSDEGVPATSDYHGVVRIYKEDIGRSWHPVLDFRELGSSALDHYFVVGVSELRNGVRAVKCSRSRYPAHSQDVATFYQFTIPMCDIDSQQVQLEEEHIRLRLARSSFERLARQGYHLKSVATPYIESNVELLAATILKLFSIYLADKKEESAKNLVNLMPKEHVYKLPEYAWHKRCPQHFIDALTAAIEEREKNDENEEQVDIAQVLAMSKTEKNGKNTDDDDLVVLKPKPLEMMKNRQDYKLGPNGQLLKRKRKNVDDDDEGESDNDEDQHYNNDDCVQVDSDNDQGDEHHEDENMKNGDKKADFAAKGATKKAAPKRLVNSNGKANPFKRKK